MRTASPRSAAARTATPAFLLVALVAGALAGCISSPAPLPGSSEPPAVAATVTAALAFASTAVDTLEERIGVGGEPSIAAAPDGTLYISIPHYSFARLAGVGPPATDAVWRSLDHGVSWRRVGNGPEHDTNDRASSGDSDIAVDADGVVYLAGLGRGIPFSASMDRGATWEVRTSPTLRGVDREWIVAWGSGELALSWQAFDGTGATAQFVRSHDGGHNWTAPRNVSSASWIAGPVVRDATRGGFVLAQAETDAVKVAMWADAPDSEVRSVQVASVPGADNYIFPVAAVDEAGDYFVVWSQAPHGSAPLATPLDEPASVWMVASSDGGATWSEPVQVSEAGRNAVLPWVTAGSAGRIAVTYLLCDCAGHPNRALTGLWYATASVSLDALGATPSFETAPLRAAPVHRGSVCGYGGGCTAPDPQQAGDRGVLDFFESALTPRGEVVAAIAYSFPGQVMGQTLYGVPLDNGIDAAVQIAGASLLADVGEVKNPAYSPGTP